MLRLGIAGIGAIAGDYIGLIVGGKVRDVALTALCSRNEAHIREAAQRHGLQAAAFTDYGAMLRSGQVDAILICTPHAQHPEMTRQALEAGLHVLVEKPVGIFADEVAEILPVLAERPELVCGVMYNRRAAQAYRHVKNLVQSGELGELVRCSWIITNLYRTEAYYTSGAWRGTWQGEGGGLLMTQVLLCKQAAKNFHTICKKETALKRVLSNLLSAVSLLRFKAVFSCGFRVPPGSGLYQSCAAGSVCIPAGQKYCSPRPRKSCPADRKTLGLPSRCIGHRW